MKENGHMNANGKFSVQEVDVNTIVPLKSNPPTRLEMRNLKPLMDYMEARLLDGQTALPESERLLVGNDGVLGDGHRRLQALKLLGVSKVKVEVDPTRTSEQIWAERGEHKILTTRQISEALSLGFPEELTPMHIKKAARRLKAVAGMRGYEYAIKHGMSVRSAGAMAAQIAAYTGTVGNVSFAYRALKWVYDFKMTHEVRHMLLRNGTSPASLKAAIETHRPIKAIVGDQA